MKRRLHFQVSSSGNNKLSGRNALPGNFLYILYCYKLLCIHYNIQYIYSTFCHTKVLNIVTEMFVNIHFRGFNIAPILAEVHFQSIKHHIRCGLEMFCSFQSEQWLHHILVTSYTFCHSKGSETRNHLINCWKFISYSTDHN